jgi:hypothetical protein
MIYATCLNEQSNDIINEDFTIELLIENCNLQSELIILSEGALVDKFINVLKTVKKFISNFLKTILNKFIELKNKIFKSSPKSDVRKQDSTNKFIRKTKSVKYVCVDRSKKIEIYDIYHQIVKKI